MREESRRQLEELKAEIANELETERSKLADMENAILVAEERLHHVNALLGFEPPPSRVKAKKDEFLRACEEEMLKAEPSTENDLPFEIHVRNLRERMLAKGGVIPGKGTETNIVSRLQKSPHRFVRTKRGTYAPKGIMDYQDHTLAINDDEDRKFTDAQLVEDWHTEFPNALHLNKQNSSGVYTYVRDIRRCYNQGRQGHGARDDQGRIVGPARVLSEPYDQNKKRCTEIYGQRWLQVCLEARQKSDTEEGARE